MGPKYSSCEHDYVEVRQIRMGGVTKYTYRCTKCGDEFTV